MRRHIHRVVRVIALAFHHWNHHRTHGRYVGTGRAGNASKQRAREHVTHAQTATNVADQCPRKVDDFVGNTAMQHQFASEDKKRNGKE